MIYLKELGIQLVKTEDFLKYLYRTDEGKDVLLSQSEYNCLIKCNCILDSASVQCRQCKNFSKHNSKRIYME